MAPHGVVARDPRVLFRDTGSGVLLLGPDDAQPLLVTGAAQRIWQMLEVPCTRGRLIDSASDEASLPAELAEAAVAAGLDSLGGHVTYLSKGP